MTGVEGYVESAASGLVAGINLAHKLLDKGEVIFPRDNDRKYGLLHIPC